MDRAGLCAGRVGFRLLSVAAVPIVQALRCAQRLLAGMVAKDRTSSVRPASKPRTGRLMFKDLATSRRFAPLFWCQLCSALNDNFLKNALVMLILYGLGGAGSSVGTHGPVLVTLAGIVFIAPFFILSALGGELADRYDKAQMAAHIKLAEIPIAGLAAIGFFLHSVSILFVTLALFGIVAALFGPVKYGILPEKLT